MIVRYYNKHKRRNLNIFFHGIFNENICVRQFHGFFQFGAINNEVDDGFTWTKPRIRKIIIQKYRGCRLAIKMCSVFSSSNKDKKPKIEFQKLYLFQKHKNQSGSFLSGILMGPEMHIFVKLPFYLLPFTIFIELRSNDVNQTLYLPK